MTNSLFSTSEIKEEPKQVKKPRSKAKTQRAKKKRVVGKENSICSEVIGKLEQDTNDDNNWSDNDSSVGAVNDCSELVWWHGCEHHRRDA